MAIDPETQTSQYRKVLYWRLLTSLFSCTEQGSNFEHLSQEIVQELSLPSLMLDPTISIENLLVRYPELEPDFTQALLPRDGPDNVIASSPIAGNKIAGDGTTGNSMTSDSSNPDAANANVNTNIKETETLRRALIFSKLLLNAFGPNTQTSVVTAQQYAEWLKDVGYLERAMGYQPGTLQGRRPGGATGIGTTGTTGATPSHSGSGGTDAGGSGQGGSGAGGSAGSGFSVSEEQLQATLKALEGDLIDRMALREVLQDDELAAQLTPSMPLMEQLLRDKANLSGNALKNAKRLIQQHIDELAEVLRLQVAQTVSGKIDRSVPPKLSLIHI